MNVIVLVILAVLGYYAFVYGISLYNMNRKIPEKKDNVVVENEEIEENKDEKK